MESFFAMLKTECFYNAGELTVDELMKQIDDYMDYYNRERCSLKLKKLSPVAYRTQLAQSALIGFYECPRFGVQFKPDFEVSDDLFHDCSLHSEYRY